MIQALMAHVLDGHDLTRAEAREAMQQIMQGDATQAQIAGFLVALRAKGETGDQIAAGHGSFDNNIELAKEIVFYHRASWK